jgi:hypothetical protein
MRAATTLRSGLAISPSSPSPGSAEIPLDTLDVLGPRPGMSLRERALPIGVSRGKVNRDSRAIAVVVELEVASRLCELRNVVLVEPESVRDATAVEVVPHQAVDFLAVEGGRPKLRQEVAIARRKYMADPLLGLLHEGSLGTAHG